MNNCGGSRCNRVQLYSDLPPVLISTPVERIGAHIKLKAQENAPVDAVGLCGEATVAGFDVGPKPEMEITYLVILKAKWMGFEPGDVVRVTPEKIVA